MTVTNWVEFFLTVSALSLFVSFLFTRQVIGADTGTAVLQKIAGAMKEGAEGFLKRQYRTVAALLGMGLLAKVVLAVGNQRGTAIITADAVRELALKPGDSALALIKATEVMIGRP